MNENCDTIRKKNVLIMLTDNYVLFNVNAGYLLLGISTTYSLIISTL